MIHFKALTIALILTSFLSVGNVVAMNNEGEEDVSCTARGPSHIKYEEIKDTAKKYVAFMQKVGQSDTAVTQEEVSLSQLFAHECTKIENLSPLFTLSSGLPDQLNKVHNKIGKWTIKTLWTTASLEDRSCTVQIAWEGEKIKEHTTMVTLFLDDAGKISQIHEVYGESDKETLGGQDL